MNYLNGVSIVEILHNIEKMKLNIVSNFEHTIAQNYSIEGDDKTKNILKNFQNPFIFRDFPIYFLKFVGSLPIFKKEDKAYVRLMQHYYGLATSRQLQNNNLPALHSAVAIIEHHFEDNIIRDIDNRNRKFITDAIRYSQVIKDDDIQHYSIYEEGFSNQEETCVKVFIIPKENLCTFFEARSEIQKTLIQPYEKKYQKYMKQLFELVKGNFSEENSLKNENDLENIFIDGSFF